MRVVLHILLLPCLLLLGGSTGCDGTVVLVSASCVPLEAVTLRAVLRWGQGPVRPPQDFDRMRDVDVFSGDRAFLGLRPPPGASGELGIALQALDATQCALAAADSLPQAVSPGQRVRFELTLARTVRVVVNVRGAAGGQGEAGTVIPDRAPDCDPAELRCTGAQCAGTFTVGQPLRLTPRSNRDSYFAGWGEGACEGQGQRPCELTLDAPADVQATAYFAPRVCSVSGWCWDSPLPQGNDLHGVWSAPGGQAWAVGAAGVALSWDGQVWAPVPSGAPVVLRALWGRPSGEAWAVGDPLPADPLHQGTVLHFDGAQWQLANNGYVGALLSVWTGVQGPVWAVNEKGDILRQQNPTMPWLSAYRSGGKLNAIWGDDRTLWAVGVMTGREPILSCRVDADCSKSTSWMYVSSGLSIGVELFAVWGVEGDVWIAGDQGTLARWDGAKWDRFPPDQLGVDPRTRLRGVWGTGRRDIWVVGDQGTLLRWDGQNWSHPARDQIGPAVVLSAIHGRSVDDFWVAGNGGILLHGEAGGARFSSLSRLTRTTFYDVWGRSADDVWAVGTGGSVLRRAAGVLDFNSAGTSRLRSIWGRDMDLWAVAENGTVQRYHREGWRPEISGTAQPLYALSGAGPDEVWAAGDAGTVLHRQGGEWSSRNIPAVGALNGLFEDDNGRVWTVGAAGGIWHWNGSGWDPETNTDAQKRDLYRVSGAAGEVWAVGAGGLVLRRRGSGWMPMVVQAGVTADLRALWGRSADDAWAAGSGGALLHLKNGAWESVDSGTPYTFVGMWGQATADGTDIFAVGGNDMVLHLHESAGPRPR